MKTSLITGASTGIGRATAITFAKNNYHIYLVARSTDKLEETAEIIRAQGGEATILPTDLSEISDINNLIEKVKQETDTLHCIANIAGIWHGKDEVYAGTNFADFDQQVILDTYIVGFTAPTLLVHGLLPLMPSGSSIINLSGTFSKAKGWLPYFASKRGLEDFSVGLAEELEEKGIRVNCISPADTATEQYKKYFPQYAEEALEPDTIAEKIYSLAEKELITGKTIVMRYEKEPMEGFHS